MANELQLSSGPYRPTVIGLELTGESSEADWKQLGQQLRQLDEAKQWMIGDWLVDGKRHYGDGLYQRAAGLLGYDEGTLRKCSSLAGQFELCRRRHNLTWGHHYEVASIKPIVEGADGKLKLGDEPDREKIAEMLKMAEKEGLSVAALREKVREYKEWQREHIRLANEPEKYAVIYADPPWLYTSGDQHTDESQETVIGTHYPSMSMADLKQLPVKHMAAADSVLFLWVTSPLLDECFELIAAWGFEYKTSMVWDKVAHNVGNYVSVRHEFLLICTRGTPPKVPKLVDSVYTEERTEHSRKPKFFRDLIDELYPNGNRIEMFAREKPDGWEVWGNEV